MRDLTEERCIIAISEMHPFTMKEISDVFDRCKSIDKTIYIIRKARFLRTSLNHVCEIIGV